MKYYKDNKDNVYGIGDGEDELIKPEWVKIKESDIKSIVDSKKTQPEKDAEAEDIEWFEYLKAEAEDKKSAWKLAGKPKYKG